MESTTPRKERRVSLHRRVLSQTSTVNSLMHGPNTLNSTDTTSLHSRAITPSSNTPAHRYRDESCDKDTAPMKQVPRLSRESSAESKRPMTPVSSLLLARLQQERRAESERIASSLGPDPSSSIGDVCDGDGSFPSSRISRLTTERQPGSSQGDDSSQKSIMGAKQIEKAVSTLHKQNFDLKLELFHRRERQSTLEMRVEELEAANQEMTEAQDNLLRELVLRDKAIEEAVNMIVKLETRLDDQIRDKETARPTVANSSHRRSWSEIPGSLRAETPKQSGHNTAPSIEPRAVERMPSFLSERSADTQHLRSVVLQNYSTPAYVRGVSEVSESTAEWSEANRVASPSLSMLSESSFLSIYGSKQGQDGTGFLPLDHISGLDGTFGGRSPTPTNRTMKVSASTRGTLLPNGVLNMKPEKMASLSGHAIPVNAIPNRGVPLRKVERRDEKPNTQNHTFRPSVSGRRNSVIAPVAQFVALPSRPTTTTGKRERGTLQNVVTKYPTYRDLGNSHVLPPTPDTASSSIIRENNDLFSSQNSLPMSDDVRIPKFLATPLPHGNDRLRSLPREVVPNADISHTQLSNVARNRTFLPTPDSRHHDRDLLSDLSRLARSAAHTTSVHRRRSDSFVSDSDSDGGADAHSETEGHDYWMRESYKPNKENLRSKTHQERERSPSPDLFSFPNNAEGWHPDVMFGVLQGGGFLGSPAPALKRDPNDEIAAPSHLPIPSTPKPTGDGPKLPARLSSLNPQDTSHSPLSPVANYNGEGYSRGGNVSVANFRPRSNSIDGFGAGNLSGASANAGSPAKRSQYPPISGLQSRARGFGLNSFFRKSGSENQNAPSNTEDTILPIATSQRGLSNASTHARYPKRPSGRSSVPPPAISPWSTRPTYPAEEELASATPPPIMRSRPPPIETDQVDANTTALGQPNEIETEIFTVTSPTKTDGLAPGTPQSAGGMRKWLHLGRRSSLKNHTG